MRILFNIICIVILAVTISSCQKKGEDQTQAPITDQTASTQDIVVGGLYASRNDDGTYGVMKVLAVDDFAVHLRSYKNRFRDIPKDLDTSVLSLGGIDDPDGFGIGHFPLAKDGFWNSEPIFLIRETVTDDELEGYRMYLDAMRQ